MIENLTPAEKIAAALRKARRRAGLKQTQMAEHIGISQPSYSRIERFETEIRVGDLVLAMQALNCSHAIINASGDVEF